MSRSSRKRNRKCRGDLREELAEFYFEYHEYAEDSRHRSLTNVELRPKNENQRRYLRSLKDETKSLVFATGPAGTGKTLFAVHIAINDFMRGAVKKIVLTRPATSVDEDLGFLPGTLEEKMDPWLKPIYDIFADFYDAKQMKKLIEGGQIEICPLAFMRGRTFKDTWIIADEMQNSTDNQLKMLLTRIGRGSRMVVTGDLAQADRGAAGSGLRDFIRRLPEHNPEHPLWQMMAWVAFGHGDIERHPIVSEVLRLYGDGSASSNRRGTGSGTGSGTGTGTGTETESETDTRTQFEPASYEPESLISNAKSSPIPIG